MVESSTGRHVQAPEKLSDLLIIYERLLALYSEQLRGDEFNPYQSIPLLLLRFLNPAFQMRYWKYAAPFLTTSNTLAQDLVGGNVVLRELEALDDQILRGVAECNRINLRRLLRRSVLGWRPTIAGAIGALVPLLKTFKDGISAATMTILPPAPSLLTSLAVGTFIGFVIGIVANLVLSMPKVGFVRALDDLIAIAAAHRGAPRKE